MAVSAFKSTTRRRGIQGTPTDQESSGGPSRTLSDHLTAHHHKMKYHRRSSSYTDLSPYSRHSGDSPRFRATRQLRFLDRQLSEPKRSDSLSRDQSEMYNIIKAEVFDVVADMKDAIENDIGRRKIFKYVSEQEREDSLAPARSGSILDDDACVERLSSEQILLELEKETQQGRWSRLQSGSTTKGFEENKDGLVLPWLQWEEANVQCHSSRKTVKHTQECTLQASSEEEVSFKFECDEKQAANGMQGTDQRKDDYVTVSKSRYTKSSSIKSSHVADSSLLYIQSTELISERIQFRARVDAGELLLCIGTLHIF